ncbi:YolD-like family protein [Bacillus sp. ISL-45]|uniref:YolD-like family protein n=1 Tax=Bacillus sp. ISL-45 TaxID=2819128 RepID=UPI001BE66168|nr:YolD-like family protein [Bacillus sp. ISL-45]MBT2663590.1 YolD-like family protein [Bacillus sp. ISL-45]
MRIRDRGKIKFMPAHFMPEHRALLRELARDELRQARPLLDEYEIQEFENRVCYAMEYTYPVKITKWEDGFTYEEKGHVHFLDPIRKEIRMVGEDGSVISIKFKDIVGVKVKE